MVSINGELLPENQSNISYNNRGTFYGDAVFETIRCLDKQPIFFEAHYFRLMASMRILRMDIPDSFTPEYLENHIKELLDANELKVHARVRLTVWRSQGGFYTPSDSSVQFSMEASELENILESPSAYEVELFKDHYLPPGMLGNLKTANKLPNILAGVYAKENDYADMLLINQNKMVVEAISGNLFLRNGDTIKTPPLSDGCLNGIMREQVINQVKRMIGYSIAEESITPFELQRADELFVTNVIKGIVNITKYRKKSFDSSAGQELRDIFNEKLFQE
jgi:branched-chain amino acid aminotransferase